MDRSVSSFVGGVVVQTLETVNGLESGTEMFGERQVRPAPANYSRVELSVFGVCRPWLVVRSQLCNNYCLILQAPIFLPRPKRNPPHTGATDASFSATAFSKPHHHAPQPLTVARTRKAIDAPTVNMADDEERVTKPFKFVTGKNASKPLGAVA